METVVKYDMPAAEYFAHPAVNQSRLKKLAKANTPRHFKASLDKPEPDKGEFAFGRALHTLLLEPEKFDESVLVWKDTASRAEKYKKFALENPGKDIILASEAESLPLMADAFRTHPLSRGILNGARKEVTIFWADAVTNMGCKARLDILHEDGVVYDIKTARDASLMGFAYDAKSYGYDRQAAWYLDAATAAFGEKFTKFGFVVLEKEEPFEVQVFYCDEASIERGRQKNARDLAVYAHCLRTGIWPGYPQTVQTLTIGV